MLGGYGVMLVWTLLAFGSSIAQDLAEARGAETEGWQLDLDMLRILSPFKTAEELNGESLPQQRARTPPCCHVMPRCGTMLPHPSGAGGLCLREAGPNGSTKPTKNK